MTKKTKEPKEPKDTKSVKKHVKRMLPCRLDEVALAKLATDLGANLDKIAALEERKKAEADAIKGDIGLLEEATSLLRDRIRSKSVDREVECEEVIDYRAGELRVTRLDTKEVFQKRTLTREELQLRLDAQKPAGKLLAMDGGKGKEEKCSECGGEGKIMMGEPPLPVKCGECMGSGRVPSKDPLKAKLGDVAATHATNKKAAEGTAGEDDGEPEGHPEVEKALDKLGKGRGKKKTKGAEDEFTPPDGCAF